MLKVGFIGLGVMGAPMALCILKGGHPLTVYDLNAEAVKRLTDAGAKAASTPAPRRQHRPLKSARPAMSS